MLGFLNEETYNLKIEINNIAILRQQGELFLQEETFELGAEQVVIEGKHMLTKYETVLRLMQEALELVRDCFEAVLQHDRSLFHFQPKLTDPYTDGGIWVPLSSDLPQVLAGQGAVGAPGLGNEQHALLQGAAGFLQAVVPAHGVLHAQVALGKHVGLVEGKHLQHLGRPAAHAFDGGEVLREGVFRRLVRCS